MPAGRYEPIGTGSGGAGTGNGIETTLFADLPAAPTVGTVAAITDGKAANCADGTCTTWSTAVSGGGGSLNLLLWYNGVVWSLIGAGTETVHFYVAEDGATFYTPENGTDSYVTE